MDRDIFENASRADKDRFYMDKKDVFSQKSGYVWTRYQTIPGESKQVYAL